MALPPPSPQLLLLAALARLLGPSEVMAGPAEEAGAHCPESLWPLPPQVSPRVTYTRVSPGQAEDVTFLYHPCAHPWLKLQLALLAYACMANPSLTPDSSLTHDRPLVLTAWGLALEMAWVEPAWAAHWLMRRRRRKQRKKKAWIYCESLSRPTPSEPTPGRGRLCQRGCVQALALAFALRSWRPPGTEVTSQGPGQPSPSGAKRRRLRAALGPQPTRSALRFPSASPGSLKAKQSMVGIPGRESNGPSVPTVSLLPGASGGNASSRTEAQVPNGQGSPGGCVCSSQASPAPRAAAPPRAARGPTPRTEEAAWAAMALTFLLVLLTLATLCTRLHRNFRRGESIYWGPTADSQDTVAGEEFPPYPRPPPHLASPAAPHSFPALLPLTARRPAHSCAEAEAAAALAPGQALPPETPPPAHAGQRPGRRELGVTAWDLPLWRAAPPRAARPRPLPRGPRAGRPLVAVAWHWPGTAGAFLLVGC
ncbi:tumor protein p53-inducible protein 13 isoform X1 [Symphalangus syndactylus]|uniref:tumor protein p53-inducible protein 13 isoform X1 n=2 Tax=Symphalangus syndactylus TaxID=9590 RepID=UPI0030063E98